MPVTFFLSAATGTPGVVTIRGAGVARFPFDSIRSVAQPIRNPAEPNHPYATNCHCRAFV
jgi:hypothetical protein